MSQGKAEGVGPSENTFLFFRRNASLVWGDALLSWSVPFHALPLGVIWLGSDGGFSVPWILMEEWAGSREFPWVSLFGGTNKEIPSSKMGFQNREIVLSPFK